jgi:hypothetical protein
VVAATKLNFTGAAPGTALVNVTASPTTGAPLAPVLAVVVAVVEVPERVPLFPTVTAPPALVATTLPAVLFMAAAKLFAESVNVDPAAMTLLPAAPATAA